MSVDIDMDMRLFELLVEPRPRDVNDLSGFTCRTFSVLEL